LVLISSYLLQRQSISPSRAAEQRVLQRALSKGKAKRKMLIIDANLALNASDNAAAQECEAEARALKKAKSATAFSKKTQRAVTRRHLQQQMREQAEVLRHAAQLRQLIHDVVKHAYKQPVRYDR